MQIGSGPPDGLRIRIWDNATSLLVYDSLPGGPDDLTLTSPISGGNIKVH